jgi:ATP-dependent DNA helicase RecG
MINPDVTKSEPGTRLAFVEKPDISAIAETMVAFANTEGGTIIFGLREDGEVAPRKIDSKSLEKALKEADAACNPPVVTGNWEEIETEKGTVYTVRVPRSIELHALTDGRVLIRSGIKNRPLGGQEILKLASAKSTGDFERDNGRFQQQDDYRIPRQTG